MIITHRPFLFSSFQFLFPTFQSTFTLFDFLLLIEPAMARGGGYSKGRGGGPKITAGDAAQTERGMEPDVDVDLGPTPLFPVSIPPTEQPFSHVVRLLYQLQCLRFFVSSMDHLQQNLKRSQSFTPDQPKPLSKVELDQVDHFLTFRRRIHDGPVYAIIGDTSQLERYGTFEARQFNPFHGLPTYSDIYAKKKRTLPQLNTISYGISLANFKVEEH
jgi:hypothetical protein